ncbi:hypothetical protein RchiOBHm_Chr6g0245701 [Rosa chinensis]|uniref:Uncharacterized protein n=1 Tax=Rosa chinensis TaxID=74649 RepID=A0A2P6PJB6_ROSCH|nr:hypothetical protein RchiOBHm_Chr6g0245701 [Rosa chinensis]
MRGLSLYGWTLYEILKYVPEHNWIVYEQALQANPVLAKMVISQVVYTLGSLSHYYYQFCEVMVLIYICLLMASLVGFLSG